MKGQDSDNKGPSVRTGRALIEAARQNPEDYPGVVRMLRLQQNPHFTDALESLSGTLQKSSGARDEALRAAIEPARQMSDALASVAKAIRPVYRALLEEYAAQFRAAWVEKREAREAALDRAMEELREAEARADVEWEARFPCARPKTQEDWMRLAVRAGISADLVLTEDWAPVEILPVIEGYFQRLQDQCPELAEKGIKRVNTASASGSRRGPLRLPFKAALGYVEILRKWAAVKEADKGKTKRESISRLQFAQRNNITVQDLKRAQSWYQTHRHSDGFPEDPRDLSEEQLRESFPRRT